MTGRSMLLVHSPLVGPSSWRPLDATARGRGFDVLRPDLTGVTDVATPRWRHLVDVAVQSAKGHADVIVVGHSGAGAMLPTIAERIGDRLRAVIFVDAVVPPPEGVHTSSQRLLELLDSKAMDDLLPRWLDWWPSDVVDALIPTPDDQDELRADMPQLPRSFFDDPIPVPSNWSAGPCAYLKLSAAYDQEYAYARDFGWARSAVAGTHLSIFTAPATVLDAIDDLAAQVSGE